MHGLAVASSKLLAGAILAIVVISLTAPVARAQTTVGVTVCSGNLPTITINQPVGDSVVTAPMVALQGNVSQASQIEVQVDDVFDSVIQLSVGQTSYNSTVQLPIGTHTIKLTAINVCPGGNGNASVVVTYEQPPGTPSTGGTTDTEVGSGEANGVQSVSSADGTVADDSVTGIGLPERILMPLRDVAEWLNIDLGTTDTTDEGLATMSFGQAISFTAGVYLVIIGLAPSIAQAIASFPVIASAFATTPLPSRMRFLSDGARIFGFVLVVGALFVG